MNSKKLPGACYTLGSSDSALFKQERLRPSASKFQILSLFKMFAQFWNNISFFNLIFFTRLSYWHFNRDSVHSLNPNTLQLLELDSQFLMDVNWILYSEFRFIIYILGVESTVLSGHSVPCIATHYAWPIYILQRERRKMEFSEWAPFREDGISIQILSSPSWPCSKSIDSRTCWVLWSVFLDGLSDQHARRHPPPSDRLSMAYPLLGRNLHVRRILTAVRMMMQSVEKCQPHPQTWSWDCSWPVTCFVASLRCWWAPQKTFPRDVHSWDSPVNLVSARKWKFWVHWIKVL